MIYINARCRTIIKILLNHDNYLQPAEIADMLKVSKRSIYYDFYRINDWLSYYDIEELEIVRGKGILLKKSVKEAIEEALQEAQQDEEYIFSPMERSYIIYCSIMYEEESVYIEQLMEYCGVSRNTIFNDLGVLKSQLQDYDLELAYEPKTGYYLVGNPIKARAVFIMNFHKLQNLYKTNRLGFLSKEKIDETLQILTGIEKTLKIRYVEGVLLSLAALYPIMLRGAETLEFPNLKQNEIEETLEYQLIDHYFSQLNGQEKIYLCLHLLGSRVTLSSEDIFDVHPNQTVYEVTKALVTEFEKIACVRFENRETLEQALFMHINASLYRYQYGIQIGDDMCEDIIREYPDLFEITKLVVPYLERQIGLPVSDSEIAYLALHFGAHLMVPEAPDSTLRILIVCVNGVSTSNMIKREVQKMLPEAQIIGVESITDLKNAQNKCDIIISTVKMKSVVPVVRVHPILTKQDREAILNHPRVKNSHVQLNISRMFQEIRPYVKPENWEIVKETIEEFLFEGNIKGVSIMKEEKKALLDLLTEDKIQIKEEAGGWIPTLFEAGEALLQNRSIERRYLENIISQIQFYGPYMFITPRVILAHAKPEDGVNYLDATMMICKEDIEFSDFHKANIIIVLATEDQEKHLRILKDIADIFSIQNRVDELLQCNSPKEVREYLMKIKE